MRGHVDQRAVRENELRLISESFNATENVVPATAVQPGRMIFQFIENFIHFKRRQDRLDQDGRSDRTPGNADRILSEIENVVPKPRFQMVLQL
jgi:hypothetical protein